MLGKLQHIQITRQGMEPGGDGSVWKLPRILELTKAARGITSESYEASLVDHKVDEESSVWRDIALSVLALAFTLLGPLTGGLSLLGTAAISSYMAVEHLKEYELQKAMSGTDFDQARAIADEPSFIWVALDILAALVDLGLR